MTVLGGRTAGSHRAGSGTGCRRSWACVPAHACRPTIPSAAGRPPRERAWASCLATWSFRSKLADMPHLSAVPRRRPQHAEHIWVACLGAHCCSGGFRAGRRAGRWGGPYEQAAKRFIRARMGPGAPWPWCRLVISADELRLSGWPISRFRPRAVTRKRRGVRARQCAGCRHSEAAWLTGPVSLDAVVRGGYLYGVIRRIDEI